MVRPKGTRCSKDVLKCEASSLSLQESFKPMIIVKEVSSEQRQEMREVNINERFKSFMQLKSKKMELMAKELELKTKEVDLKVSTEEARDMTVDLSIVDDETRAWYVKTRKKIMKKDD